MTATSHSTVPSVRRRALFGAAAALAALPAMPALPALEPHPDAEVLAACAEHARTFEAFANCDLDSDENPYWPPYVEAYERVAGARPRTLEGLAAKASAAKLEARGPDGEERPDQCAAWLWDLANDAIRLADAVPPTGGVA